MDGVVQFSVLRNRSIYAQEKLKDLGGKGSGVSNPMFIPALGAEGLAEVNVFKYPMEIMNAKKTLEESEWCHLVRRKISDRVSVVYLVSIPLFMFSLLSVILGLGIYILHNGESCQFKMA